MTKLFVYVTRKIASSALLHLEKSCDIEVWKEDYPIPRDTLLKAIAKADGLLSMLTEKIDDALFDAAPRLKVVGNMAVGFDNVDVPAATRRRIPIGNTPGVLTEATADLAFALLLAAARRLPEGEHYVREGSWKTWSPNLLLGRDVYGTTLGIIGFGRIGQAVARRAKGFGMQILYHGGSDQATAAEIGAEARSLEDVLRESDYISLHVPLSPKTYHLIDTPQFELMKPTAILINTARGGVVNPSALYTALRSRRIEAAALDVTEPEPIPHDDPLLKLDNCLIVPHIGSATVRTRVRMAMLAADNILAGLRGERLPHCINPNVYE